MNPSNANHNPEIKPKVKNNFFWYFIIFLAALYLAQRFVPNHQPNIPYTQFKNLVKSGTVEKVTMQGQKILGEFKTPQAIGPEKKPSQFFTTTVPAIEDASLIGLMEQNGTVVKADAEDEQWFTLLVLNMLPWMIIIGFFYFSSKKLRESTSGASGKNPFNFHRSLAKVYQKTDTPVTFNDVAGLKNAKNDLKEIVDFLKQPEKYAKMGAKLPKGLLLVGPPGTGKTLLAKATAGEADVPFFSLSASEFIEMFVGVGASRVRDLFQTAKKQAPSIIFIDEIDSIGRSRGTGLGGGNDEREQTLNQILSEMDGFDEASPLVVMAATNRPDVLDPALVRPGRFDRQVVLDLPQREARKDVIKIHARKVPLESKVDFDVLASDTMGFSGADLSNLVNEAALFAARKNKDKVGMQDFMEARDKIILGNERDEKLNPQQRELVAYHEAGHTLVAFLHPKADPLRKVSIIPRGRALGATEQTPAEERYNVTKSYLEGQLQVLLGGRVAEEIIFDDVTTGAEDDLKRATKIARKMVTNWGMSEKIGPLSYQQGEEHPFLGREIIRERDYSDDTARLIDEEVKQIITEKRDEVKKLLIANKRKLQSLANQLLVEESLDFEQIKLAIQMGETFDLRKNIS